MRTDKPISSAGEATERTMKQKLYYRELGCWMELEEEVYLEIRRERQRTYYRMHKEGRCYCAKRQLWLCDGMCDTCGFYKRGEMLFSDLSSDKTSEDYLDVISDGGAEARRCEERLCREEMLQQIAECMPEALVYGQMKLDGKTDEEIAAVLGVTRMTIYRRVRKLRQIIEAEIEGK